MGLLLSGPGSAANQGRCYQAAAAQEASAGAFAFSPEAVRHLGPAPTVTLGVAFIAGTLVLTDTIGKTFNGHPQPGHHRHHPQPGHHRHHPQPGHHRHHP